MMDKVCCKKDGSNYTEMCFNIQRKVISCYIVVSAMVNDLMTIGESPSLTSLQKVGAAKKM
jgi:hypothetical protein